MSLPAVLHPWHTSFISHPSPHTKNAHLDIQTPKTTRRWKANSWFLENDFYRLEFDRTSGGISRLLDKKTGHDVFSAPAATGEVIEDYQSDTWAHNKNYLKGTVGVFSDATLRLREWGDVCAILRSQARYKNSTLTQDFTIYRDRPEIDVHVTVNWQEEYKILKICFPLNATNTHAIYQIPYGSIKKAADGQEEPGLAWAAVQGQSGNNPVSVAVVNDSCYSYSVDGNVLRFIAVRSAGIVDHYGIKDEYTQVMDIGMHELDYSIVPGAIADASALTRLSAVKNQPVFPLYTTFHKGNLPLSDSFAYVEGEHVLLNVIKSAEDGDGIIVRLCETSGEKAHANIVLGFLDKKIEADFDPFEIKTFLIGNNEQITEVNLLEHEV